MTYKIALWRKPALGAVLLLAACTDNPLGVKPGPVPPTPKTLSAVACSVDVKAGTMQCREAPFPGAPVNLNVIVGGQNHYVKLSNFGTEYDAGARVLSTYVVVENLLEQALGTPDGSTITGVDVFFFSGPTATAGDGTVYMVNPTGTNGEFTGPGQTYYRWNQILKPYEISDPMRWQFGLTGTVTAFAFTVYVSAEAVDESVATDLGHVWTGSVSSAWNTAGNWQNNSVPDSTSSVRIPGAASISGSMPAFPASGDIENLRVFSGGTITGTGHMRIRGNANVEGTITAGTVQMTGSAGVLNGTLATLLVNGTIAVQDTTVAYGPVTITNGPVRGASLTLNNYTPFTIVNRTP
ncbi:MAG TPA: hypothetical protein VGB24_15540 [Longimicrobium sp.]|jgi:hypothetical protein|uniref:hypothetical protein n=1 Tax=Longimicrobium sp. TaxID=2029185 RepID=UPI002ED77829